jgi:hypothetical protein
MICPQCKCEYIRGVRECADCGVPLVDKLEPAQPDPGNVRLVAVWRGYDPNERDGMGNALEEADIPFTFAEAKSIFFHTNEATLEIWVADADRERANQVVTDLDHRLHPDEVIAEEEGALALPESDAPEEDEADTRVDSDLDQEWYEDETANEVWAGDVEELANTLIVCFREVGIASRKLNENGRWSVAVRPLQEARAKEIVREVLDASPSE